MRIFRALIFSFIMASCTQQNATPITALKNFVDISLKKNITLETLIPLTHGDLKLDLENSLKSGANLRQELERTLGGTFRVLSSRCESGTLCYVTYVVSFRTQSDNVDVFKSEVKKLAKLEMINGSWLVSKISNIKEYHESLEQIGSP